MKKILLLLIILLFGFSLRVYQLDKDPIELFGDELDVGLQANSILQTGKDYAGNSWPVMFKSFGEYRLPLYIYSSVPIIGLFGLNEWGLRLTDVVWGMLGLVGIYFLTTKLFDQKTGLAATFLLAISPWDIQFSRQAGIEALFLLTLVIWAVYLFLKGLEDFKWLIGSVILFALSIYAYATAVVFTPLIFITLTILNFKTVQKIKLQKIIVLGVLGLVVLIPYLNLYRTGQTAQRFSTISIWSDKSLEDDIVKRRQRESSPLSPIFNNKLLTYTYEAAGNYTEALSLDFLFFKGDPNLRHSIGAMGEFYWFELFLLLTGLWLIIQNPKVYKSGIFILLWLVIAPLPASLTRDGSYHASRLIFMLLPLTVICSLGLVWLWQQRSKLRFRVTLLVLGLLMVVNFATYIHRYYVEWPQDSWRFWQYGFKDTMSFLKQNDSSYSHIFINSTYEASFPRYLFWYQADPRLIQNNFQSFQNQKDIVPGFEGFSFNNRYYFGSIMDEDKQKGITKILGPGDVYVASYRDDAHLTDWRQNPPKDFKVLKTITDPNNDPIFFVVSPKI